ncbi:hypothetical protein FB45DRAFT_1063232 [Roridomyces roridus]|uniref:Uncharacterized protein n=1 Tax=Roridomyces roridus TaxID=1738132 RepID=A0AAD7FGF2_9AGAR|nr:hypothetical protein FB45DRAFT_1063232 [Roridomyces roridus]
MPSKSRAKNSASEDSASARKAFNFTQLLVVARLARCTEALTREVARVLGIPDCNTKKGLKSCHESFEKISSTLDSVFAESRKYTANQELADVVSAAVLAIYVRMGEDNILRKRVFSETQFIDKSTELLRCSTAGQLVMGILSDATHIPDTEILIKISRCASTILDSTELHLDHQIYVENAVCVLTHVTTAALGSDPDPELFAAFPRILRFLLDAIGLPHSTPRSFGHFLLFVYQNSAEHAAIFLSIPDTVDFLVACTKCADFYTRVTAQRSLTLLCSHLEAEGKDIHPERKPGTALIEQVLEQFSRKHVTYSRAWNMDSRKLFDLYDAFTSDPERSELGRKLADLVLDNEALVRSACLQQPELTGMLWECKDALPNDVAADILHTLCLLVTDGRREASTFARASLERHPSVAFFYYIVAVYDDDRMGIVSVLFADKGLQCSRITPFLQTRLLFTSISSSHRMISVMMQGPPTQVQKAEILIKNASLKAKAFVELVPPDEPDRTLIIAISIHLEIMVRGHIWTKKELKAARGRFSLACDVARCTEDGFNPRSECIALDKIFSRTSTAWKEWGATVSREPCKEYVASDLANEVDPNAALAAWLEKLQTSPPDTLSSELCDLQLHSYANFYLYIRSYYRPNVLRQIFSTPTSDSSKTQNDKLTILNLCITARFNTLRIPQHQNSIDRSRTHGGVSPWLKQQQAGICYRDSTIFMNWPGGRESWSSATVIEWMLGPRHVCPPRGGKLFSNASGLSELMIWNASFRGRRSEDLRYVGWVAEHDAEGAEGDFWGALEESEEGSWKSGNHVEVVERREGEEIQKLKIGDKETMQARGADRCRWSGSQEIAFEGDTGEVRGSARAEERRAAWTTRAWAIRSRSNFAWEIAESGSTIRRSPSMMTLDARRKSADESL